MNSRKNRTRKVASPLICHYFRVLALTGANRVIHTLADCKRALTSSESVFHNSCLHTFSVLFYSKIETEAETTNKVLADVELLIDVYGPDTLISEFRPATPLELLAILS